MVQVHVPKAFNEVCTERRVLRNSSLHQSIRRHRVKFTEAPGAPNFTSTSTTNEVENEDDRQRRCDISSPGPRLDRERRFCTLRSSVNRIRTVPDPGTSHEHANPVGRGWSVCDQGARGGEAPRRAERFRGAMTRQEERLRRHTVEERSDNFTAR